MSIAKFMEHTNYLFYFMFKFFDCKEFDFMYA